MASPAIGLAVVEPIAWHVRFHLDDGVEPARRLVEESESAAQRQQHAASRTGRHGRYDIRTLVRCVGAVRRVEDVELLADDVDPAVGGDLDAVPVQRALRQRACR